MTLLTVRETAELLCISESLVYRLKDEGKLPFYRIASSAIRFKEEDLFEYLESCRIEQRQVSATTRSRLPELKHLKL